MLPDGRIVSNGPAEAATVAAAPSAPVPAGAGKAPAPAPLSTAPAVGGLLPEPSTGAQAIVDLLGTVLGPPR